MAVNCNSEYIDYLETRIAELEEMIRDPWSTNPFKKIEEEIEKHEEKYPGTNYVTFPNFQGKDINVLTKFGKHLLSGEGLLGQLQIDQQQETITALREALEQIVTKENTIMGETVTTASIAQTALRECFGDNSESAIKEDL